MFISVIMAGGKLVLVSPGAKNLAFRKPFNRIPRGRRKTRRPMARLFKAGGNIMSKLPFRLCYPMETYGATTTTTPYRWEFSVNSIYRCNITASGGQPHFRDQIAAMYSHYRVLAAKIELFFSSLTGPSFIAVGTVGGTSILPVDYEGVLGDKKFKLAFANAGDNPKKITYYTSVARAQDVSPKMVRSDDTFAASMNNNPSTEPRFCVMFQSQDLATSHNHYLSGRITYYGYAEGILTVAPS